MILGVPFFCSNSQSIMLWDPISPSGSFPSFPSVFAQPVLHQNTFCVFNITYSPSAFPKVLVYTSSYYCTSITYRTSIIVSLITLKTHVHIVQV